MNKRGRLTLLAIVLLLLGLVALLLAHCTKTPVPEETVSNAANATRSAAIGPTT